MLRDADPLIGILNEQRDQLTQLASDSEQILGPSRASAPTSPASSPTPAPPAEASAERGDELEASLQKFPDFLREFRATMRSLGGFSNAATPVFADLGKARPGA